MQALTAIGEVGIEAGGRSYLLRPSLFSMTQIGSPAEIVYASAILLATEPNNPDHLRRFRQERFEQALIVWYACAGDQDIGELVGGMAPVSRADDGFFSSPFSWGELVTRRAPAFRYVPGRLPMADIVAIAQMLIRHGVVGNAVPSGEPGGVKGTFLAEFNAVDYAAAAMAHLGVSETDAWRMTMTSFVAAMHSKFPPPAPGSQEALRPHTAEEYDATMDRLRKINELRAKANG